MFILCDYLNQSANFRVKMHLRFKSTDKNKEIDIVNPLQTLRTTLIVIDN